MHELSHPPVILWVSSEIASSHYPAPLALSTQPHREKPELALQATPLPSLLTALQTNMGSGMEFTSYLRARHIFTQEENRMCLHTTMIFCITPILQYFSKCKSISSLLFPIHWASTLPEKSRFSYRSYRMNITGV